MTWVYPANEAVVTTRLGIAVAFFWVATVFLAGGAADVTVLAWLAGAGIPWLSFAAVAILVAVVAGAHRVRDAGGALAVIVVALVGGTACWMLASDLQGMQLLDGPLASFPLLAACLAVTLAASMVDPGSGAVGTALGFLAGQAGIALGYVQHADPRSPLQVGALVIAVVVMAFHLLLGLVRRNVRAVDNHLNTAGRAELEAGERRSLEMQSRALLHDTVLSELAALGMARPGPLSPKAARSIQESLAAARQASTDPVAAATPALALDELLERVRLAGLRVSVTGDAIQIDRLPGELRSGLLLALEQCLVNVLRHAGVDRAELSVMRSDSKLVATVVDEGAGFDESAVPDDRFGFRESVRGRIDQLGGSVRVLSTPGFGTSIIIAVPVGDAG